MIARVRSVSRTDAACPRDSTATNALRKNFRNEMMIGPPFHFAKEMMIGRHFPPDGRILAKEMMIGRYFISMTKSYFGVAKKDTKKWV